MTGEEGAKGAGSDRRGPHTAAGGRAMDQWQIQQPVCQKAQEAAPSLSATHLRLMVRSASHVKSIPTLQAVLHLNKCFFLPRW